MSARIAFSIGLTVIVIAALNWTRATDATERVILAAAIGFAAAVLAWGIDLWVDRLGGAA